MKLLKRLLLLTLLWVPPLSRQYGGQVADRRYQVSLESVGGSL